MDVTQIIDQTIGHDDNVDSVGADNADRRVRHLEYLREVQADLWWLTDFSWKKRRALLTVAAGAGRVVTPPDFDALGNYGGLYVPIGAGRGDGRSLEIVPESVIMDLRESNYRTNTPELCALFDQDDFNRQYVQLPLNDAELTLSIWYNTKPPTLDEIVGLGPVTDVAMTAVDGNEGVLTSASTDFTTQFEEGDFVRLAGFANDENNGEFTVNGVVTATTMPVSKISGDDVVAELAGASVSLQGHVNDIKRIPEKYHQRVIMPGMRAKARESKGDARWQRAVQEYERGQVFMKREEQRFQGEFRQLPSFFGRHVY